MNRYTNFTSYIKEDDLTKTFLVGNLVRDNINNANMLGNVVKDLEKGKQKDLHFGNMLKKIQGRIRSVMGLLSKICPTVDIASLDEEGTIDTDLEEIKYFVGQALYFYEK